MRKRPCAASVFVVAVLAAGSAAPAHGVSRAACGTANTVATMTCLVNVVRAQHGLPPVRTASLLIRSARLRARAIARCRQFSHTPCGQSFGAPFRAAGYARGTYAVGENLAYATAAPPPQSAIQLWLASPPHRRVLLTRGFRDLGAAVVTVNGLVGGGAATVWVAHLGRRR
jgi:uncharacterized protein YkwD